ncbi:MAG: hypothetical protein JWO74_1242 [Solirubrobacterales bacterium]|nr:hypothetical protein [Solirubrobacterales bacterium]
MATGVDTKGRRQYLYIDPRAIDSYERGTVIELPRGTPEAATPLRIDMGDGGVVIELPTDATGRTLREDVERRVQSLLRS